VVLVLIPSWAKFKQPLKVSEASLARIREREREKALMEEADKRRARKKAQAFNLNSKPQ
jgi:hypothetical protein